MVIDNIKNAKQYKGLGERIKKGLDYLQSADFESIQDGTYEIDGDNVYVVVRTYQTIPQQEGRWEAHKKYIDIQYMIDGDEFMGYTYRKALECCSDYDKENDIYFLDGKGNILTFKKEEFMIFFPDDAHMPYMSIAESSKVRKAVVKVKV